MSIAKIVQIIAAAEGLKVEVGVGNIREIVGIVSDILYSDTDAEGAYKSLLKNGERRQAKAYAKKRAKKN